MVLIILKGLSVHFIRKIDLVEDLKKLDLSESNKHQCFLCGAKPRDDQIYQEIIGVSRAQTYSCETPIFVDIKPGLCQFHEGM